jgi:hypothetical protein
VSCAAAAGSPYLKEFHSRVGDKIEDALAIIIVSQPAKSVDRFTKSSPSLPSLAFSLLFSSLLFSKNKHLNRIFLNY